MRSLLCFVFVILTAKGFAQPYVDPFHVRYTYGIKSKPGSGTPFTHLYFGPDLPIKLGENKFLVISPIFERWDIDSAPGQSNLPDVKGVGLALSAIFPLDKDRWSLTITAIPRVYGQKLDVADAFQFGGVVLATYNKRATLKFKLGVYANAEFFGPFIIPLAGIDWRIDKRNNLFGVLPGRLTFEHLLNSHFYTGATFRAITNSYRIGKESYLRIDDNQLSGFLDCYLSKHFVFTGEAGYGILRKLRSGTGYNKKYLADYNWADGMFVKLSASYRIRL